MLMGCIHWDALQTAKGTHVAGIITIQLLKGFGDAYRLSEGFYLYFVLVASDFETCHVNACAGVRWVARVLMEARLHDRGVLVLDSGWLRELYSCSSSGIRSSS